MGHDFEDEKKTDSRNKQEASSKKDAQDLQNKLSTPPFQGLNVDSLNTDQALTNGVKFIATYTSKPNSDYLFVTSMNDVCPKETEFFQRNSRSQ